MSRCYTKLAMYGVLWVTLLWLCIEMELKAEQSQYNLQQCNSIQQASMLDYVDQYHAILRKQSKKFHAMHHHNTTMYCSESDSIYHHDSYYAVLCNVLCSTMPLKTKQFHVEQCNPTSSGIMRYVILRETCSERWWMASNDYAMRCTAEWCNALHNGIHSSA